MFPRQYFAFLFCPFIFCLYFTFDGYWETRNSTFFKEFTVCSQLFSPVWLFTTHGLFMGFSRQEYRSGLPFPPPGVLPHPGIGCTSPGSPAWQADSFPLCHLGRQIWRIIIPLAFWLLLLLLFYLNFLWCFSEILSIIKTDQSWVEFMWEENSKQVTIQSSKELLVE